MFGSLSSKNMCYQLLEVEKDIKINLVYCFFYLKANIN